MFHEREELERVGAALQVLATDLTAPGEALGLTEREAPAPLAPEVFDRALELFSAGQRVDMRALAAELGMGRTSLYRKVGSRERLLGELVWHLLQRALRASLDASGLAAGAERVLLTAAVYMDEVSREPWLRAFLEREAPCALRVLLDRSTPAQRGLARAFYTILETELQRGNLDPAVRPELIAYPVVRICQSFVYLDLINRQEPDVQGAVAALTGLLHGHIRPARSLQASPPVPARKP